MQTETKSRVEQLNSHTGQPIAILRFEGNISSCSHDAVLRTYQSLPKASSKIVLLDFTHVNYLNSSGIALIIKLLLEATSSARQISAFGLSPHFIKVFTMVGITKYVRLFANQSEALAKI
ncbi:MAG: STAS domain-containing protein [Acidobacteriota bacterium]|nr:STAS domain-containing protein [Acidobacteriota bacterium]